MEALISIQKLKYDEDMDDFMMKFRQLNVLGGMAGEILRSTIKAKISNNIRYRFTAFPTPDTDEEFMRLIVKLGKIEEAHKRKKSDPAGKYTKAKRQG